MEIAPSENLLKLRELSEKLYAIERDDDIKEIMNDIKMVLESSKKEISVNSAPKEKIRCYEKMCTSITNLLQNIK
jgi:hypothetical protein